MKTKYIIINETTEIPSRDFKEHGSIADALTARGLQNGSFSQNGEFETLEAARAELAKHRTAYRIQAGFAGVRFYAADVYYIAERGYNDDWDEWEDTGSYEFAEEAEE